MNKKIVLFGALTLCITTASLAMQRDDWNTKKLSRIKTDNNTIIPKKMLSTFRPGDSETSSLLYENKPHLTDESLEKMPSPTNYNSAACGSVINFGYTDEELIKDKKLPDIMRKFYGFGPDESFDYLNKKNRIGLLWLAKREAFNKEPKETLAKKINSKQNQRKKKKKIIAPLKHWPCRVTQKYDNPQIVREKPNFKNQKKKKAWKKEWKKRRKPSQKNQEHSY